MITRGLIIFSLLFSVLPVSAQQSPSTTSVSTADNSPQQEPPFTKEFATDVDWKSPSSSPPYSTIVKISSALDGSVDYFVYDKDWHNNHNGTEVGILTRWSTDSLEGKVYLKSGCGLLACPFGIILDQGGLPSPMVLQVGSKEFKIYGNEGSYPLPQDFKESLINGATSVVLKLGDSGRTLSLGEGSVNSLKSLYTSLAKVKIPVPTFKFAALQLPQKTTLQKAVVKFLDSVVELRNSKGQSSGFVVNSEGEILTNRHAVGASKTVQVKYSNGETREGNVLYRDNAIDFALIKVPNAPKIQSLPLCYLKYPVPADDVVVLGSPLGLTNSVTRGIVSSVRSTKGSEAEAINTSGTTIIQSDAPMTHGNSGGPMLNSEGEVIAIVDWGAGGGSLANFGFGVSIIDILEKLNVKKPPIPPKAQLSACGNILPSASGPKK